MMLRGRHGTRCFVHFRGGEHSIEADLDGGPGGSWSSIRPSHRVVWKPDMKFQAYTVPSEPPVIRRLPEESRARALMLAGVWVLGRRARTLAVSRSHEMIIEASSAART